MAPEVMEAAEMLEHLPAEAQETAELSANLLSEEAPPPSEPPSIRTKRPRKKASTEQLLPVDTAGLPFPFAPRSVAKDGTISAEKFFDYWHSLWNMHTAGEPRKTHLDNRQEIYIQRQWPVLNYWMRLTREQVEGFDRRYPPATRKPSDADNYLRVCGIKKYLEKRNTLFESKDWKTELLRRFGSGDYKIFLNDIGVPEKHIKRATICKTVASVRDEQFPPVLDIDILDMNEPMNQSFIQERKMRGLPLPGDKDLRESEAIEDEEMQAQVVEQILSSNKGLTEKVIEMSQERSKEAQPAPPPPPDATAATRALDLMADAAKRASEASAAANNPQAYVDNVLKMAERLAPKPQENQGENGAVKALETMMKMQEANHARLLQIMEESHKREVDAFNGRLSLMEKLLTDKATAAAAVPAAAVPAPNSMVETLKQFVQLKKIFDGSFAGEGSAEDVPGWVPTAERVWDLTTSRATDFMRNLAAFKAGRPPIDAEAEPESETAEVTKVKEDPQAVRERMLADSIRPYLDEALTKHYKGYEFAGNVIASFGIGTYREFTNGGETGLTNFLMRTGLHPPLVAKFGASHVGQFITEFMDAAKAQEVAREITRQNQAAANGAPAAPAPPPRASGGPKVNPPTQ